MATLQTIVGLVVAVGVEVAGQTPTPQAPDPNVPTTFEAASVKANNSGEQGGQLRRQPGGRVTALNMPLRQLIGYAYQTSPLTLVGGPAWINTDRFDITAKLAGDPPPVPIGAGPDQVMLAMRTLFADRFKLKVHRETRELDAYALVVAKPGNLGPGLKRTTQDCSPEAVRARAANPPAASASAVLCGARIGPGRLQVGGMPIGGVLGIFAGQSGRNVVDRTGLTGEWDFELTFTADAGRGIAPGTPVPPADDSAPSFFTAVQEQLGLRLEPTKAPIEVLVIDGVEHPTPD